MSAKWRDIPNLTQRVMDRFGWSADEAIENIKNVQRALQIEQINDAVEVLLGVRVQTTPE